MASRGPVPEYWGFDGSTWLGRTPKGIRCTTVDSNDPGFGRRNLQWPGGTMRDRGNGEGNPLRYVGRSRQFDDEDDL